MIDLKMILKRIIATINYYIDNLKIK